jgi:hypothetical protein
VKINVILREDNKNATVLCKKELPKNTQSSQQEYVGARFKAQPLKEDWAQVTSKKYRKKDVFNSTLTQIIPTTNNGYARLYNLKDEDTVIGTSKAVKICNSSNYLQVRKKNQLAKSVLRSEHKVMIIGDSHAKNVLQNFLITLVVSLNQEQDLMRS